MAVTVAKAVRDAVADPQREELSFRVIAELPNAQLLDLVTAAMRAFEHAWDNDPPIAGPDGPVAAPDYAVSPATPDVIVSLVKLTDLPISFERVLDAIASQFAPSGMRVRIDKPKRARIAFDTRTAMLNLRIALHGRWISNASFELDVDLDTIQANCVDWLRGLSPTGELQLLRPDYRFTPIAADTALDTLRTLRDHPTTQLAAVHGDNVRGIATWLPHGWLSILSGTTAAASFDWHQHWAAIDPLFRTLTPVTDTAIVCHARSLGASAGTTHTNRRLWEVPGRADADNSHIGRAIEDHSLVDAEGRFFKATAPCDLDIPWHRSEYENLTQFDAPNIDDWLQNPPGQDVLQQGRRELGPLLRLTDE